MANGRRPEQKDEKTVEKNFEGEQNDDSPVGEARRSFYSGA